MGQEVGRLLFWFGIAMVIVGGVLWVAPGTPWLGKLPGDLHIERPGFRLSFPLATCLLASVVITLVLNLLSRLR